MTSTSKALAPARTPSALVKMTSVEARLFVRDPGAPITVIGIPVVLLLVFSMMPGIHEPSEKFGGHSPLATFIAPLAIAILLAMLALTIFPTAMATYREKGVLRRLSASPVAPSTLLGATLVVNLAAAIVVVLVVVGLGGLALGMNMPANLGGFLISIALGTAALFSFGLLVAAFAPTARAAGAIGSATLFPMLALGGVWVPKEQLPAVLRALADVLPLGATLNSLRETWSGANPGIAQLVAMVVVTAVCGAVAARFFRWE